MAASDARPVPRKNAAWRVYFAIRKSDGTLITSWTGADSEVSKDGGSFADCTDEATEVGTSGCGYLDLSASEMNADAVTIKITVTNTGALPLVLTVFPEEAGDYRADVTHFGGTAGTFSSGRPEVNTTHWAGTAVGSVTINCNMTQISGDTTAADNAESFFDGTGYAGTNNVIPTVSTVSNRVTANTDQWNGVTVTGMPMPTYTQPTGFLAATFPTSVASPTNITSLPAVTLAASQPNYAPLTTLGANAPAGWINAAAIATDAINASNLAADAVAEIADGVWDEDMSGHTGSTTYGGRIVRASNSNVTVQITGSNHISADVHAFQTDVIVASAIASSAVTEIQSGLATAEELAKVPKSGETRRYTQVAANEGNKTADVSIGVPL